MVGLARSAQQEFPQHMPSYCLSPLVRSSESSGGKQTLTTQCEQNDRDWEAGGQKRGAVEEVMCR